MSKHGKELLIILGFIFVSLFIFRNYFLKNTVPFPAHLLVSFYQPWMSYLPPVANKPMGFDNLRIYYPLRDLTVSQTKSGQLPLWNPYTFSGNTLLATYQSAVFHPLSPLFFVLPLVDAWSLIIITLPILASIFTFLFLRDLGISRKGGVLGAIAFAFSGYSIVWWEESFMSVSSGIFLPLSLLGINRIFKNDHAKGFLLLTLSLVFSILSGWFQVTMYVFLFSFLWALFLLLFSYRRKIRPFLLIIASFLISILVSAVHLIPAFEAYLQSPRGNTDAKYIFDLYFLKTKDIVKIIFPDFFGNPGTYNYSSYGFYYETTFFIALPLFILALYGLFCFRKSKILSFFSISFLICLSLAFSLPTSWFLLYHLKIPILSTILPSRIILLSTFSLSVVAAFGWDYLIKKPELKKIVIIGSIILAASIIIAFPLAQNLYFYKDDAVYLAGHQSQLVSLRNMLLPVILFFSTIGALLFFRFFKQGKYIIFSAVLFLSLINVFYFSSKYLYFSEKKYMYPDVAALTELKEISGVNRVWGFKNARIENNFAAYYQLYSAEGYDSIYIKRYGELFHAAKQKGVYNPQIPRTDANLVTNDYEEGIDKNLYRKKLMELLSIRFVMEHRDDVGEHKDGNVYKPVWHDETFTIFEYIGAYPRTFLADDFKVIKDPGLMIETFFDPKTDLRNILLLEEKPDIKVTNTKLEGNANITFYSPNKIKIATNSNKDSLLFLSDPYFTGWNSYVDSKPSKTYRADFAFRSVVVPSGKHSVEFIYQPKSFQRGAILTIIGIVIMLIVLYLLKKSRNQ